MVSDKNGTLYSARPGSLGVFDKTTGQHTEVMPLPANISPTHDLTFYKGKLYLSGGDLNTLDKNIIYEIDLNNPANNKIVAVLDLKGTTQALTTIVDDCQNEHFLLCGSYTPRGVYELNMEDFTYSMVCPVDFGKIGATSPSEFLTYTCQLEIDLDTNDSAQAPPLDWRDTIYCLPAFAAVGDTDLNVYSDYALDSLVVWLENPPDGPGDYLTASDTDSIGVAGSGSQRLTFTPILGSPTDTAFAQALLGAFWQNDLINPTPGVRTIHVVAYAGEERSDTATAFLLLDPKMNEAGRDTSLIFCAEDKLINLNNFLGPDAQPGGTWSPSLTQGGSTYNPVLDGPGVWQYVIQNSPECPADTASISITLLSLPSPDLGPDQTACQGEIVTLSVPAIYTTYAWNGTPGGSTWDVNTSGQVIVEVTNADGCAGSDTIQVSFTTAGDTLHTTAEICTGASFLFHGTNYQSTGIYTVPGAGLCDTVHILDLTVLPNPLLQITGDTVLCAGEAGSLTIASYPQIKWSTGATGPSIPVTATGPYAVTVTANEGCVASDTIFVTVLPPITTEWDITDPSCVEDQDGEILLTAIQGGAGNYVLQPGGDLLSPGFTLSDLGAGTYTYTIIDADGCTATATWSLTDPPAVWLEAGPELILNEGAKGSRTIQSNAGTYTLSWTPPQGLNQAGQETLEAEGLSTVVYQITLTDANGCTATDELVVRVIYPLQVFVPTAFSPNGDGINDVWRAVSPSDHTYPIDRLTIWDRWGNLLLSTPGLTNETGWDGTFRGRLCDPGVYVYEMVLVLPDGSSKQISGEVELVR
ncbi:MAG: gliding motility-associated C-terminal domain-containing protein [Saprospiraceae bacterium]|nr:gliding motility-associated C-terminal domain-containing protein [Saprospiraceae bacterium]